MAFGRNNRPACLVFLQLSRGCATGGFLRATQRRLRRCRGKGCQLWPLQEQRLEPQLAGPRATYLFLPATDLI